MALITVKNVSLRKRLDRISLQLNDGEVLGLIGPNGAGKSSLLNVLGNVVEAQGEVMLQGSSIETMSSIERARQIGLLPQESGAAWSLLVEDVVALGRMPWGDNDAGMIEKAVDQAGIRQLLGRNIDRLSGGERARVWLGRVLAGEPRVLLADEPVASLDIHHQLEVMKVLRQHARPGQAVIVALHDLALAARFCDRLCLLDEGKLVALGKPHEVLTGELLYRTYGIRVEVDLNRSPPLVMPA
jgi:iron complex transport system ATP-binding protein